MHTAISILDLSVKHITLFLLGVTTDSYFNLFELITMNVTIKTIRTYFDGLLIYGAVSLRFGEICMFHLPEEWCGNLRKVGSHLQSNTAS
jgi:hypothetical protein